MRQPQGYTIVTGPGPGTGEWDTYTCAHCNRPRRVMHMAAANDMPDVCHLCGDKNRPSFICEHCRGKPCIPFEKKMERWERRAEYDRLVAIDQGRWPPARMTCQPCE